MEMASKYKDLRGVSVLAGPGDSGMLTVKAFCRSEIRRIPILNRELTFDELCIMLGGSEKISLEYRDDQNDWIQLTDDLDILHAASLSQVLTIRVRFDNEQASHASKDLEFVRRELAEISQRLSKVMEIVSSESFKGGAPKDTSAGGEGDDGKAKAAAEEPKNVVKPLSTADMAELLESSANRRKSETATGNGVAAVPVASANHARTLSASSQTSIVAQQAITSRGQLPPSQQPSPVPNVQTYQQPQPQPQYQQTPPAQHYGPPQPPQDPQQYRAYQPSPPSGPQPHDPRNPAYAQVGPPYQQPQYAPASPHPGQPHYAPPQPPYASTPAQPQAQPLQSGLQYPNSLALPPSLSQGLQMPPGSQPQQQRY